MPRAWIVAAGVLAVSSARAEVQLELRSGSGVTILLERQTVRCDDSLCTLEIRVEATTDTSPAVLEVAEALGDRGDPAEVSGERLDPIEADRRHPSEDDPFVRRDFFVVARPGVAFVVLVRRRFELGMNHVADELEPPIWIRHPLVAGTPAADRHATFMIVPARAARRLKPANLSVEVPAGRAVTCGTYGPQSPGLAPAGPCDADPGSDHIFWIAERGQDRPLARIEARTGPPRSSLGGPFVGIGGTFGEGFLLQSGWDFGILPWLIGALSVESDVSSSFGAAAVLELAGAMPWGAPWWGLGIGPVVSFAPEARAGGRAQLHLHLYLLGATVAVDVFDGPDGRVSLLGTIAL